VAERSRRDEGRFDATPRLSLIVCTAGRPHCVERLLQAVASQTRCPDETLVVDASRGSAAQRTEKIVLAAVSPGTRYLHAGDEHRGLTRQRNLGIRESGGELVAFLDDDTVPRDDYFEELGKAFDRRPSVVGVGGWIDDGLWQRGKSPAEGMASSAGVRFADGWIEVDGWRRREGVRWRLRRILGLAPPFEPGCVPPEGHGWPISFLAPGADEVPVDCLMGGASAWRRTLLDEVHFSTFYEGYGLYEDLDFSLRAGRRGELVVARAAVVRHLHEPSARPRPFRYGKMVVRNGWRVWRVGNPRPRFGARVRWWTTGLLLAAIRAANVVTGPARRQSVLETAGRLAGFLRLTVAPPPLSSSENHRGRGGR